MIDISIMAECEGCEKKIDLDKECNAYCYKCEKKLVTESDLRTALYDIAKNDYNWKRDDAYEGFASDAEKKAFMRGIKHGYSSSIFWFCDFFDLVKFYENEIGYNFEYVKNE